jgi:hypothetical protein
MHDHVSDKNYAELNQLLTVWEIPEFVKEAAFSDEESVKDLPRDNFADPGTQSFPIHSQADTWLSTVYFLKHAEEIPQAKRDSISARLLDANQFWSLSPESFQRKALEKTAAAMPEPVLVLSYNDAQGEREIPIYSQEHFEKTAEFLLANRHVYPLEARRDIAAQLLGSELVAGLDYDKVSDLEKTAGCLRAGMRDVMNGLLERVEQYKHRKHPEFEKTLLGVYKEAAAEAIDDVIEPEGLDKIARVVDELDRIVGLHAQGYSANLPAPESMFGGLSAHDMETLQKHATQLSTGDWVFQHQVKKHAGEILPLLDALGVTVEEGADPMQKLAEADDYQIGLVLRELGSKLTQP